MMPEGFSPDQSADIRTASSTNLPIDDSVIDFVLTSPPYCTRIDYAVATLPELCIMGYGIKSGFDNIRRSLIGACTVPKQPPAPKTSWGKTCLKLVENISSHTTKAAKTYYLKNHLQYFDGLFNSIGEIARVTKPSAKCAIVVQDSYFKDVHNDLPMIFIEMAEAHSLHFKQRYDFPQTITMGSVNRGTSLYRGRHNITESVLFFENRKVPNYESRCRYRRSIPD
jgi:hypothetical protein